MTGMSNSAVRVIDPILTTVVLGYANQEFIGHKLFPRVPVKASGGQVLKFGKESFKLYSSRRAAGGSTGRVQFGYLGDKFTLENHSLEGVVPREHLRDANQVPGIDLGSTAVRNVMRVLALGLEVEQSQMARNPANYPATNKITLSGTSVWSNPASTPLTDIDNGRDAIRAQCGLYPNILTLSPAAFKALKNHPTIIERVKYTSARVITEEMLAGLFNIKEVVVGNAIFFDDSEEAQDVWGKDAVMGYAPQKPSGMEEPSYGYTYTLEGCPMVEPAYYENNTKSWLYPTTDERAPVLAGITAGYLIKNAG